MKEPKTPNVGQQSGGNLPDTPEKSADLATVSSPGEYGGIKPDDPLLNGIQGNIVKGHGRDHVKLVFLQFKEGVAPDTVKAAFGSFVNEHAWVQSAKEQLDAVDRYNHFRIPGPLFSNVLFSASGLKALGLKLASANSNKWFEKGAREAVAALNDPPPAVWELAYQERIDALIILADDDLTNLISALDETIRLFDPVASVMTIESGNAIRNKEDETVEHFGYVDGRSQPLFLDRDIEKEISEFDAEDPLIQGASRFVKYDPRAEKELVLVHDCLVPGASDAFGSYFVFRKLEQNVRGFKQHEEVLADQLGLKGDDRELAGALVVGRFEDGTPVVMRKTEGLHHPVPNNFNYEDDAEGRKCPFAAHIRKTNPRGDTVRVSARPEAEERAHRIARRGITYGKQDMDPTDPDAIDRFPIRDVGLLFMCFQANIENQFGFMQSKMANAGSFAKKGTGIDPVIGQLNLRDRANPAGPILPRRPVEQNFPLEWGEPGNVRCPFHGFVTMKGGEFFYAPSMPFLRRLSPSTLKAPQAPDPRRTSSTP